MMAFMKIQTNYANLVIIVVNHVRVMNLIAVNLVTMISLDNQRRLMEKNNVIVNQDIMNFTKDAQVSNKNNKLVIIHA